MKSSDEKKKGQGNVLQAFLDSEQRVGLKLAFTHQTTGNYYVWSQLPLKWNHASPDLLHGTPPTDALPRKIFCSNTMWGCKWRTRSHFQQSCFQEAKSWIENFLNTQQCLFCSSTGSHDCPAQLNTSCVCFKVKASTQFTWWRPLL